MRKAFKELIEQENADFDAYQRVYEQYWRECAKMQRQYDLETSHGRKYAINDQWKTKIDLKLSALSIYELKR